MDAASDAPPDEQQARAIEAIRASDANLLLLAPVGSGKTRTLADRVVRAVERGVVPSRVLCLTFTNRAADEMRARVASRLPDAAGRVRVSTFHGLCARFLQAEHRRLGLPADFTILDEDDQGEVLREVGASTDRQERQAILDALRDAKSPPDSLDRADPRLALDAGPGVLFRGLPPPRAQVLARYQRALADRQALDFDDLVRLTRALLRHVPDLAAAWAARFDLVQVDEVQDAHESEYEVVRAIARGAATRLALIGDVDQTIYTWRGSAPRRVLEAFRRDFAPVQTIALRWNHRSTRRLVRVANAVLEGLPERATKVAPAPHLPEGEPAVLHRADDVAGEAAFIAREIGRLVQAGTPHHRIGVLVRRNALARAIGAGLARAKVPHVTVEEFEFFRRQEVKDAVALLRLVLRPDDSVAALRALTRPARGLGDVGLARLRAEGGEAGLRLCDVVGPGARARTDPLLPALDRSARVALDVETTGLDPAVDEVIEVGAVRLGPDGAPTAERFHALLRPTRPVGASTHVHGLTEEVLAREGRPAAEALAALAAFVGDATVVGHNVAFDAEMLSSHAARVGLALPLPRRVDTLVLARRFLDLPAYDLASVVHALGGAIGTAHRALDDALAAADAFVRLRPFVARGATARARLMAGLPDGVVALAGTLASLREAAASLRPADLLARALDASGLSAHYARDEARRRNLGDLQQALSRRDLPRLTPREALRDAVRYASLARSLAMESLVDDRVAVLTVHQAKGLEFDAVFVAGAVEDEFPFYYARKDGGPALVEEQRLFYVAVTRARRALYLTTHAVGEHGYPRHPSRYLDPIPEDALRLA